MKWVCTQSVSIKFLYGSKLRQKKTEEKKFKQIIFIITCERRKQMKMKQIWSEIAWFWLPNCYWNVNCFVVVALCEKFHVYYFLCALILWRWKEVNFKFCLSVCLAIDEWFSCRSDMTFLLASVRFCRDFSFYIGLLRLVGFVRVCWSMSELFKLC